MTPGYVIATLAKQVRRDTIRLVETAESDWLTFAPEGTANHILWHAGHAVWLQDVLCVQLLTGHSELANGWADAFGMDCRPVAENSKWPTKSDMLGILRQQDCRLQDLLKITDTDKLNQVASPDRGPLTVADRIIHGFHDEAKHGGEIYLLIKLCRFNAGR